MFIADKRHRTPLRAEEVAGLNLNRQGFAAEVYHGFP